MYRFLVVITLLLLPFSFTASAEDKITISATKHKEREIFAKNFAGIVLSIIHDPKKSSIDRQNVLRQSFRSSVDIDWIARFVLGNPWRNATDEQREHYTALYRKYLTETYIANFAENRDKQINNIKILSIDDEDSRFTVRTQMALSNQVILKVDYLVNEKDGGYKVLDIAIENVSLIVSHRAEFAALATDRGIDGVISKLDEILHNEKPNMVLSMK
jgi:phospholipid transport system substrate-binding protein